MIRLHASWRAACTDRGRRSSAQEVHDVGCGTGYFTRVMTEAVAPDGTAMASIPPMRRSRTPGV
jgi:ubiquinone/menaquinone biosynthesis C-methylase UbiE